MKPRTLSSPRAKLNFASGVRRLAVTDAARGPDPAVLAHGRRLPRGTIVLLRHYEAADRPALARRTAAACRRRGLPLLVAGDARLAAAVRADGLHLPEGMARHGILSPALLWRRRRGAVLMVACHSGAALARAAALGADAALLSPVFPTASHPGAAVLGPLRASLLARRAGLPVIGLGGMTAARLRRLGPAVTGWAGVVL